MTRKTATLRFASFTSAALFLLNVYLSISAQEANNNASPLNKSSAFISNKYMNQNSGATSSASSLYANLGPYEKDEKMRAWSCHGKNQRDLIDRLIQAGIIKHESVRDAMCRVDRKNYVAASSQSNAYMDAPQPIGLGQTISAPHMHAHVLEEIYPFLKASNDKEVRILDVGAGSGYLTAVLAKWVAPFENDGPRSQSSFLDENKIGKVYGIEVHQHLVDLARANVDKADKDLLDAGVMTLEKADGWNGLPAHSPFDAIHVGAAAADFPRPLLEQLKVGGVLIIPVGPQSGVQNLYRVERIGDGFTQNDFRIQELLGVRYVPLVQQSEERN